MMRGTGVAGEGDLGALAASRRRRAWSGPSPVSSAPSPAGGELPTIVVAVITGHAIGAGFQLALAADLRVLRDDAVLVMAEASLGLVPDLGGTRRLVELVGYARALEICATAAPVDAHRAERLGLANVVLAGDDFETGLERYLDTLLAIDPLVTRSVKPLLASATTADAASSWRPSGVPSCRCSAGGSAGPPDDLAGDRHRLRPRHPAGRGPHLIGVVWKAFGPIMIDRTASSWLPRITRRDEAAARPGRQPGAAESVAETPLLVGLDLQQPQRRPQLDQMIRPWVSRRSPSHPAAAPARTRRRCAGRTR